MKKETDMSLTQQDLEEDLEEIEETVMRNVAQIVAPVAGKLDALIEELEHEKVVNVIPRQRINVHSRKFMDSVS